MDCTHDEQTRQREKIESVIAGGAIGGLIGMLFGPLATLICAVVGAEVARRLDATRRALVTPVYQRLFTLVPSTASERGYRKDARLSPLRATSIVRGYRICRSTPNHR